MSLAALEIEALNYTCGINVPKPIYGGYRAPICITHDGRLMIRGRLLARDGVPDWDSDEDGLLEYRGELRGPFGHRIRLYDYQSTWGDERALVRRIQKGTDIWWDVRTIKPKRKEAHARA